MMLAATFAIWHASLIEMLWTGFGLVGLWYARKQLKRAQEYIDALQSMDGSNIKRHRELNIIAYGHYRNSLFRAAKTLVITMIGVLAMLIKPASPDMGITPVGVVITFGLFMLELLIILPGILDERQEDALDHIERSSP